MLTDILISIGQLIDQQMTEVAWAWKSPTLELRIDEPVQPSRPILGSAYSALSRSVACSVRGLSVARAAERATDSKFRPPAGRTGVIISDR
jgi:hypothetical protein